MKSYISRIYSNASFLFNRETFAALFFEGSLAHLAPSILENVNVEIPIRILNSLKEVDKNQAKDDFQKIKSEIKNFYSVIKSTEIERKISKGKTAMEKLSDYAIKNWQITNASIELTYCCNQRCNWCYLEDFSRKRLGEKDLARIAEELKRVGTIFVLFTGGEIFTRADAIEIMQEFERQGFIVEAKTNGLFLTPDKIRRLAKLNLFNLQLSLYDIHDGWSDLTNSNYRYRRIIKNLLLLQESGISTSIAVLVGKHNIDYLDSYREQLRETEIKEIFYNPYITPNRKGAGKEIEYRLSYQEMEKKFLPFLEKINGFVSPRKYRCGSRKNQPACYAGRDQISINPEGVVFPCLDLRLPLGNIIQEDLRDILKRRGEILDSFWLCDIPKCFNCSIRDYCDSCIGTALLESGNFKVPSQHKCDISWFYYNHRKEVKT